MSQIKRISHRYRRSRGSILVEAILVFLFLVSISATFLMVGRTLNAQWNKPITLKGRQ